MGRRAYQILTGVLLALVVALLGTPLWDAWYYRGMRSSPGAYVPVAAIVSSRREAGPRQPTPRPAIRPASGTEVGRSTTTVPHGPLPERFDQGRTEPGLPVRGGLTRPPESAPSTLWPRATAVAATAKVKSSIEAPRDAPPAPPPADPAPDRPADQEPRGPAAWSPLQPAGAPAEAPSVQPPGGGAPHRPVTPSDVTPPPSDPEDSDEAPPAPPAVRLVPDRFDLLPGEAVVVTVEVAGVVSMSSLPFHLRFDPDVIEFVDSRAGSALSGRYEPILLASVSPSRPGDLAVGLSLVESSGLFSGSGALLHLRFRGVAPGDSDLSFDRASLRGPTSRPVEAQFESTRIRVE